MGRPRSVDPWLALGVVLLLSLLVVAAYGDRLAPYEPHFSLVVGQGGEPRPLPPGAPFVFGSDVAGRDLLSLILHGARTTLAIVVVAGLARLFAGLALAVLAISSRAARAVLDSVADAAGAVPSTLVAVLVVLALTGKGPDIAVFIGALLVTGWAGPYRVARSELLRLRDAPFTEGARALGTGRLAIVGRHHIPHLVPLLALSASQQVAAALVALAELGVLAVFVGPARTLNFEESMPIVRTGDPLAVTVTDRPEWGALLAMARRIEDLYLTRWVFLVPGLAIAFAAIAFAVAGIGVARQYRRRDLIGEARSPAGVALALAAIAIVVSPLALPARHADAAAWSSDARAARASVSDIPTLFRDAGLVPIGGDGVVERSTTTIRQTGAASLALRTGAGLTEWREGWAESDDFVPILFRSFAGGVVDAPVVFAGWGISPRDFRADPPTSPFAPASFGYEIREWADDYAGIDVRGKVVLILRLERLRASGNRVVVGPDFETSVANAAKRGAAAVLYVDPQRAAFEAARARGLTNPYRNLMRDAPLERATGIPVLLADARVADAVLEESGLRATAILREVGPRPDVPPGLASGLTASTGDARFGRSLSLELRATARIAVPVDRVTLVSRSHVARTVGAADRALLLWAIAPSDPEGDRGSLDALARVLASFRERALPPLVVVVFDAGGDPRGDAKEVAARLAPITLDLVVGLDALRGSRLRFVTLRGELQLVLDAYADASGVPYARTRAIAEPPPGTGLEAFVDERVVLVRGVDGTGDDLEDDAAALVAYIVGRYAEGAPELRR